jgi:hypothetical protein
VREGLVVESANGGLFMSSILEFTRRGCWDNMNRISLIEVGVEIYVVSSFALPPRMSPSQSSKAWQID